MTKDDSKISTNVLEMKFMRRTKQRLEEKEKKKQESILQKAYLAGESVSDSDKSKGDAPSSSSSTHQQMNIAEKRPCSYEMEYVQRLDRFVFTRDLEFLEDLQYGRMSFKGCNPQVERLMKYFSDKKNGIVNNSDDEKDVSDDEMADTMGGSLSRTIQGKFKTKANKRDHSLIDESTGNGNIKKRKLETSASGRRY